MKHRETKWGGRVGGGGGGQKPNRNMRYGEEI